MFFFLFFLFLCSPFSLVVHVVYFGGNDKLITNSVPSAALELPKVILVKKDYCTPRTSGLFIRVISSLKPRTAFAATFRAAHDL